MNRHVAKWGCFLGVRSLLYGIKVSFWGSGTLKIAIPVENYPQKRSSRLADYRPPLGGEC